MDTFNPFARMLQVYLTCFCESGDLLSQWRAYGANGGGYSLGLKFRDDGYRGGETTFMLRRVIYNLNEQRQLIGDLTTEAIDGLRADLKTYGLGDLVADSPQDYVRKAVDLALDPQRLRTIRSGLREQMKQSELMNPERFARAVEAVYRDAWRQWCSGAAI
jgi:hypothetical protein